MKKKYFSTGIVALAMLFFASCSNQKKNAPGFTVNIHITGLKTATKVILEQQINKSWEKLDSVILQDGKGTITGNIKSPEMYYLTITKFNIHIPFWLENSKISVSTGLNSYKHPVVKGSKTQLAFVAYQDSVKTFYQQEKPVIAKIRKAEADNNPKKAEVFRKQYYKIDNQRIKYTFEFARRHNKSVVSSYLVMKNCYLTSLEKLDSLTNGFDTTLVETAYVKLLKKRVAVLKRVAPGQHFINFTLNDTTGKPVSLTSVVKDHKYTLVDFWAAWCPDCSAENPSIVAAYKKFHKKGFTVFGVSLDMDHKSWVRGINEQHLFWTQVSDLKGWHCAAGKLYGIEWIPHNLLINQKGIIIAQDLAGKPLQKELKKLMN